MTIVRARVRVEGFEKAREGMALVDTGASVTILDRGVAEDIGVEITKMKRALVTASGHRVEGVVGILRKMALEEDAANQHPEAGRGDLGGRGVGELDYSRSDSTGIGRLRG